MVFMLHVNITGCWSQQNGLKTQMLLVENAMPVNNHLEENEKGFPEEHYTPWQTLLKEDVDKWQETVTKMNFSSKSWGEERGDLAKYR